MWRFWRALPPRGKIGYSSAPGTRSDPAAGDEATRRADSTSIAETVRFERMLTSEGVLLLKFWFHCRSKQQRESD
jgi:polyphosphate kinase 2 (PPK2 family)